jgi:hypothetical protein
MYYPKSQISTNLYTNGDEYIFEVSRLPYKGYYHKLSTGEIFSGRTPDDLPTEPLIPSVATGDIEDIGSLRVSVINGLGSDPDPVRIKADEPTWNVGEYLSSQNKNDLNEETKFLPTYSYPKVTEDDYDLGSFVRYFAKKANQNLYIEIDKSQYDNLKNKESNWDFPSYQIFTLTWTLEGSSPEEVSNINKSVVATVERQQRITGLLNYFKDYSQFYQA